jgi:hypothetical protein
MDPFSFLFFSFFHCLYMDEIWTGSRAIFWPLGTVRNAIHFNLDFFFFKKKKKILEKTSN